MCLFPNSLVANGFPSAAVAVALMFLCSFAGIELLAFYNEAYWKHTQVF